MFRKFDCGCVGIALDGEPPRILIPCDVDRDSLRNSVHWFTRDMTGKTSEPLAPEKEAELHYRIASRFGKADRYENLRLALDLPLD